MVSAALGEFKRIFSSNGDGLSAAFSISSLRAREYETPSFTKAAACLRFVAVIRLMVPNWSSLPHRPQLDSSFIHWSTIAFDTVACVWARTGRAIENVLNRAPNPAIHHL